MSDNGATTRTASQLPAVLNADTISAAVLLTISIVSFSAMGDDMRNWGLPRLVTTVLALSGVILVIKGVVGALRGPSGTTDGETVKAGGSRVDVAVFIGISIAWVVLTPPVGFWLVNFAAMTLGIVYLNGGVRSIRKWVIAAVVALTVSVCAYFLFRHVFFVPLPDGLLYGRL